MHGVARQSGSYHDPHSSWLRTELWEMYTDTAMMETDWVRGAHRDTERSKIDGLPGSIYSGDTGVCG